MILDRKSFEHIYYLYGQRLINFACNFLPGKHAAEDLVHDSFIKLWDRYHGKDMSSWALSWWILSDIVDKAVSDIESGEYSARLRFGHDGCFMGMYALLGIEPWGCCNDNDIEASYIWNSSLTPMACNLQVVVFGNRRGRHLVRVLYNEKDFDLPVRKVRRHFYKPEDLIGFCRPKMEEARKVLGL